MKITNITNPPALSIIVPVFNEQEVLEIFHYQVAKVLASLTIGPIEMVYINDGSTDNSWQILNQLESYYCTIKTINLSRNFGKEAAVTAGLEHASGEAVILLDADLQDPPELIPDMIKAWQDGADIVNMKRSERLGESAFKRASAHLFYRIFDWLSDVPVEKDVGDFRLLSRRVVNHINQLPERNRYMKGIMSWPGFNQQTITFVRPERAAGETKWSFIQLVRLALSGITAFSVKPLKLATWCGGFISASAFIYGVWILFKTLLFGESVAGYPSLMLTQLFLGGIQLVAIGILGEYVGRIFTETKQRPVYIAMDVRTAPVKTMALKQHG